MFARQWGVLAVVVCSSCQCNPTSPQDGGTAGGATVAGGTAGSSSGGNGGGSGGGVMAGGSGGGTLSCNVTPGALPLSNLCDALLLGVQGAQKVNLTQCGEPLRDTDLPFLTQLDPGSCQPDAGFFPVTIARLSQKIDAGLMAYDPAAAHACQALGRMNGGRAGLLCPSNPCEQVFRGLVAAGGACEDSEDCVGELFCQPTGDTSCLGRCVARLAPGASCDPDRDLCERGSPCRAADGGFRCLVRAGVGGRCNDARDCAPNLGCAMGQCATRQAAGSPCVDTSGHGDCLAELGCVRQGGATTCQPRATMGSACSTTGMGAPPCVTSECIECVGGRCIAAGIGGAPCSSGTDCRDSYFCGDAGTCVFRARRTEPCQASSPAGSRGSCLYPTDFCSAPAPGAAGTCQPTPTTGQACGTAPGLSPTCRSSDEYCRITAGQSGTCTATPVPPEACGVGNGLSPSCRTGKCVGGVCVAPTAPGTPCIVNNDNCRSDAYCEAGDGGALCAAKRASGAACTDNKQCSDGLCDRVTKRCSVPCSTTFDSEGASCSVGCPNGLRDGASLLLFSMVLGPFGRRRRERSTKE